jgi:hypothetical protein
MAHFSSTNLTDNGVPRVGKTAYHGPSITGIHGVHRNLIQFLNGAPIVDYSSLTYTATGSAADGKILAIDSRAGGQFGSGAGATSGYSAASVQTWTITFTSATEYTLTGSVSGLQPDTYTTGTDAIIVDTIYVHILPSVNNDFSVGDTFTIDFIANPNTATIDKWRDPDPQYGYIQSGTEHAAVSTQIYQSVAHFTDEIANFRNLHSDPAGLDNANDFVYIGLGVYDNAVDSDATTRNCLMSKGFGGWSSSGNHPEPSEGRYLPISVVSDIGVHFICDQYRVIPSMAVGAEWVYGYIGRIDSYMTGDEFANPMMNIMGRDQKAGWGDSVITWGCFAAGLSYSYDNTEGTSITGEWSGPPSNSSDSNGCVWLLPFEYSRLGSMTSGPQISSLFGPPRTGDSQIPLVPVEVLDHRGGSNDAVGSAVNVRMAPHRYGQLRGVYAVSAAFTSEGDTVTVGSDTYLCVQGKNVHTSASTIRAYRAAIKLS